MSEFHLETDLSVKASINLYYDLYVPDNLTKPAPLLISVHGYGAHKRYMMREAQLVAPPQFVIAAPQAPFQHFRQIEGGYKIGFGWLTDYKSDESVSLHHNFLLEIIETLAAKNMVDAEQVYLLGFSQACALNFRFAFTFPEIIKSIVGICGGIPSDLATNENYQPTDAPVFYQYATDDEFYAPEKYAGYVEKLNDFLPDFTAKQYDAKHEISDAMRDDIKVWLNDK